MSRLPLRRLSRGLFQRHVGRTVRVLLISPMVPVPADDGGRVGILNMVRYLKRCGHEIVFVAPRARANDSMSFSQEVDLRLIDLDPRSTIVGRLRGAFGPLPYAAERFYSQHAAATINSLTREREFDVIHVEHLYVMRLGTALKRTTGLPLVLHQHNLESEIVERYYQRTTNPFVRMYAKREYVKTVAFERDMIRQANLVFPVTAEDRDKLVKLAPNTKFVVLPHGVDLNTLQFDHRYVPDRLLFLTNFGWLPNRDSFEYFCREVRPRLQERLPGLRTIAVGKNIDNLDKNTFGGTIDYRGFLPDLNHASSLASIAIVPLRIGSGVRVKILELMAMGVVVVSTSLGAEGIAVRHGDQLIIADSPNDMAAEIQRLLGSPDELRRIAVNARTFVETNHSERAIGSIVDASYQTLLETRGRDGGGSDPSVPGGNADRQNTLL